MRRAPRPQLAQGVHIPAPVGGLNTVAAGTALPPGDCVRCVNLIAAASGLRTRQGWVEYAADVSGLTDNTVRTLIPFTGSSPGANRLWAATEAAVYDVSSSPTSPSATFSLAITAGDAGRGCSVVMVTAAGHFCVYADEVNGLYTYAEIGATWTKTAMGALAGQIDNVNPATFAFVHLFKKRLWFVPRDSSSAWYLPAGQLFGSATEFSFGQSFKAGGTVVGMWSWTYDGGSGLDDSLVVLSSAGDVVIYQGTDPTSPDTWALRGIWQISPPPRGRRVATTTGGDLLLLSRLGVVPLSQLVTGRPDEAVTYTTAKIANLVNSYMRTRGDTHGWSLHQHPEDNALVMSIPPVDGEEPIQLVMALAARSWSVYESIPFTCGAVWGGKLHFGTPDGQVGVCTGDVDAVLLSEPDGYEPIEWEVLTAFQGGGAGTQKQVHLVRPIFLSTGQPATFTAAARYDYDIARVDSVAFAATASGGWDDGLWDVMLWGGEEAPSHEVRGTSGVGVHAAIAIRGSSIEQTVLVGVDVFVESGGFL